MEIKRDAYLQQLIERKDNGMIKVITGIRAAECIQRETHRIPSSSVFWG